MNTLELTADQRSLLRWMAREQERGQILHPRIGHEKRVLRVLVRRGLADQTSSGGYILTADGRNYIKEMDR
jgi:hypothetical protein